MVEYARQRIVEILKRLSDGRMASASMIEKELNLPKYFVLAALSVLEAIGAIRSVMRIGNTRIYTITENGRVLLEALESGRNVRIAMDGE